MKRKFKKTIAFLQDPCNTALLKYILEHANVAKEALLYGQRGSFTSFIGSFKKLQCQVCRFLKLAKSKCIFPNIYFLKFKLSFQKKCYFSENLVTKLDFVMRSIKAKLRHIVRSYI